MEGPTPFSFANLMAASPTCFAPSRVRACLAVTWPASLCSSAKTNEAAASNERIVSLVFMVFGFGGRGLAVRATSVDLCQVDHRFAEQTINRAFLPILC